MLTDANIQPCGSFCVRSLLLDGGLGAINAISSNGLDIYYDPAAPGNAYLSGDTFALPGGGFIAPVPEPNLAVALTANMAGLPRHCLNGCSRRSLALDWRISQARLRARLANLFWWWNSVASLSRTNDRRQVRASSRRVC